MNAVHKLRSQHRIKTLCRVLNVNRSTYYKHFNSKPAARTIENQNIKSLLLRVYAAYGKRLGAYKLTYILQRDYGIRISVGRVYRLLKSMDLSKISTRKPAVKSFSASTDCSDKLEQKFAQKAPNIVWVSDITYIRAAGKWYYLCVIIDLFSRKVIAWDISPKADSELVINVFKKAYKKRNSPYGLMFHSDRGTQYTAFAFRKLLDSLNVVQSFSKKGCPFDNAVAESFFKYLKLEETNRRTYNTLSEPKLSVFEYIEGFYNSKRPHGSLHYLTPNEMERLYYEQLQAEI